MIGLVTTLAILGRIHISLIVAAAGDPFMAIGTRVSLAYEATLRCDDNKDMVFGDFIVISQFVRVFFVDTKTDLYKQGQWATFTVLD